MRLDYRILWIDDQFDDLAGALYNVSQKIDRLGFATSVTTLEPSQFSARLPALREEEIDLVVMDFNLGEAYNGAKFISDLRRTLRHTEVVFYSSSGAKAIRRELNEYGVDGVFCSNRADVVQEIEELVETTMRKVLDLNHVRGIIMAGTSDIDQDVKDCLLALQVARYSDKAAGSFVAKIEAEVRHEREMHAEQFEGFVRNQRVDKAIDHAAFSSSLRLKLLKEELAALPDLSEAQRARLESLGRYDDEVIRPRNVLAHKKPTKEGGEWVFPKFVFNRDKSIELRLALLDHSENVEAILAWFASPPSEGSTS
jgi:DNA-binding NarL/FixJ family response regulator